MWALLSGSLALAGWLGAGRPATELSFVRYLPRALTFSVFLMDTGRGLDIPLGMTGRFMGPPAWSHDGRWLIANTGGQITRLDMRDMSISHVEQPWLGTEVSLSPDGTRLLFTLYVGTDNSPLVFTGAPDGDARQLLTSMVAVAPVWSPDGEWVVFVAVRDGGRLYRVHAHSGEAMRLSDQPARNPAWSPDGARLVFTLLDSHQQGDVFSMAVDGTDLQPLTATASDERYPAYSTDGAWLAFSSNRQNDASYDLDIYRMPSTGGPPQRLTRFPGSETYPAWRPVG
jgi:TolB protein